MTVWGTFYEVVNFEFRGIATDLNEALDSVIGPLNVAAEYVDRISKGDIPKNACQMVTNLSTYTR